MNNLHPDFNHLPHTFILNPMRLHRIARAVLALLPLAKDERETLNRIQDNLRKGVFQMPDAAVLRPRSQDPWMDAHYLGMEIARMNHMQVLKCARDWFDRPIHTLAKASRIHKPYSVYAVWYLFVAGEAIPDGIPQGDARAYIETVAKLMIDSAIIGAADGRLEGGLQAKKVIDAILDLEESGLGDADPDVSTN